MRQVLPKQFINLCRYLTKSHKTNRVEGIIEVEVSPYLRRAVTNEWAKPKNEQEHFRRMEKVLVHF